MTLAEFVNRVDDAIAALERIADVLEAWWTSYTATPTRRDNDDRPF